MRLWASPHRQFHGLKMAMCSLQDLVSITTPTGEPFKSRVTIDSATSANTGTYTCVGTNEAGTVTRDISVEVNAGPGTL